MTITALVLSILALIVSIGGLFIALYSFRYNNRLEITTIKSRVVLEGQNTLLEFENLMDQLNKKGSNSNLDKYSFDFETLQDDFKRIKNIYNQVSIEKPHKHIRAQVTYLNYESDIKLFAARLKNLRIKLNQKNDLANLGEKY